MIELTYIEQQGGNTMKKDFKTWKSLDKYVMSRKLEQYKVKGQSGSTSNIIEYSSVGWEEYIVKGLNKLIGKRTDW